MADTIKIEVVTPEAKALEADVDMVTLTGIDGEMGILAEQPRSATVTAESAVTALRIDRGAATAPLRETASAIFHVYEGSGRSTIGSTALDWKQGDTFAVPAWQKVVHENAGNATAYLFRFDDRPLMQALASYRSDDGSGV